MNLYLISVKISLIENLSFLDLTSCVIELEFKNLQYKYRGSSNPR